MMVGCCSLMVYLLGLIVYGNTAGCARGRSVVRHVGRFFFLRSDLHQIFRNAFPHDEKQAQKR
jgi:hypothetical protein